MQMRRANSLTMTIMFTVTMLGLMLGMLLLLIPESFLAYVVILLGFGIAFTLLGVFTISGLSRREKSKRKRTTDEAAPPDKRDTAYFTIGTDGELIPLDYDEAKSYENKLKDS